MKQIVDVPVIGDKRFKRWTKKVDRVDVTQGNGYAFVGNFLREKEELEVGTYILAFGNEGSMKHHAPLVVLYKVKEDGELEEVYREEELSSRWALDVRDDIAEIVNNDEKENPLAHYSNAELIAELNRRGYFNEDEED